MPRAAVCGKMQTSLKQMGGICVEALAIQTVPFLNTLAGIRVEIVTKLFNLITYLGDEKLFVVIAMIVLWCFSKRGGLYMLTVGFASSGIGQALKMLLGIPRPWNLGFEDADPIAKGGWEDSGLGKIMNKLGGGADGWSFPSGHTLISVGTYGALAAWFKNKWVKVIGIVLAVLIPFTRLYLGVHTPVDIVGGAALALLLVLLLQPVFESDGRGRVRAVLIANIVITAALLGLMYLTQPADLAGEDIHNYASGIKNLWQLVGATFAVWIAFEADEKWLHYDTRAVWWAQILKIIGGCVIVLGIQTVVQKVFGYNSSRDFLDLENMTKMGVIACGANFLALLGGAAVWPATFRWFGKLGRK